MAAAKKTKTQKIQAPVMPVSTVKLEPGGFFQSRDGETWCCFKVDEKKPVHAQANCIRVADERVEYFFLDGRYDEAGKREHTLVHRLR
jgi:hypothetical protein